MTGLVLIGGSDFVGRLLKLSGVYGGETATNRPVEITGTLVLEQSISEPADKTE